MLFKELKIIDSECSVMDGASYTSSSDCLKAQGTLDKKRHGKNVSQ